MTTYPFDRLKESTLSKLDRSPKGSIDEPVRPILDLVNAYHDWISTSSCSGRISAYLQGRGSSREDEAEGDEEGDARPAAFHGKGGGRWLFVSHSTLDEHQLADPVAAIFGQESVSDASDSPGPVDAALVSLKYEAPVLHLASRSVETALPLLHASISAGFRNSGLVISTSKRVMLGVRAAPGGLDVPIARSTADGASFELIVGRRYLEQVWRLANESMKVNAQRLARLLDAFTVALTPSPSDPAWEPKDVRHERLRREGLAIQEHHRRVAAAAAAVKHQQEDLNASSQQEQ